MEAFKRSRIGDTVVPSHGGMVFFVIFSVHLMSFVGLHGCNIAFSRPDNLTLSSPPPCKELVPANDSVSWPKYGTDIQNNLLYGKPTEMQVLCAAELVFNKGSSGVVVFGHPVIRFRDSIADSHDEFICQQC